MKNDNKQFDNFQNISTVSILKLNNFEKTEDNMIKANNVIIEIEKDLILNGFILLNTDSFKSLFSFLLEGKNEKQIKYLFNYNINNLIIQKTNGIVKTTKTYKDNSIVSIFINNHIIETIRSKIK